MSERDRTTPMVVRAVVVTFNSEDLIGDFLESFAGLDSEGVDLQLVVVDNASIDETLAIVRDQAPWAEIVPLAENRGYSAGINAGAAVRGEWDALVVLNDDIRLRPDCLSILSDSIRGDGVGIVVPKLIDGQGALLQSLRREPTLGTVYAEAFLGGARAARLGWSETIAEPARYDTMQDITWASGCAWMIDAETWRRVGAWDESFFLYAEDLDYALRARDAGVVMRYVPQAEAVHLVGPSQRNPRLWSMSIWNRFRLYRRRHGGVRSMLFHFGLVCNEAIRWFSSNRIHRAGLAALLSEDARPVEVRGR